MESPQLYAFHVLGGTFVGEPISTSGSGLSAKEKKKQIVEPVVTQRSPGGFCRGNLDDREIGSNIRAQETVILAWGREQPRGLVFARSGGYENNDITLRKGWKSK